MKTYALEKLSWKTIQYDNLFYLSLVFNGNILIKKNTTISMIVNPNINDDSELISFIFQANTTINQFIQNNLDSIGEQRVFKYFAYNDNIICRHFFLNLLQANGLADEELTNFIKQDTESIFSTYPTLRKLANNKYY